MGDRPRTLVEAALWDLCVLYGYCIPAEAADILETSPPASADEFVDAVLVAEGLDPLLVEKRDRAELTEVVRDWLFDAGRGKGTTSGLPLLRPED